MVPDSSLQEVEESTQPTTALQLLHWTSPCQPKGTALPFSSDATASLPACQSSPHQQKVSSVTTALPGYGLPSPGDNRKRGATSTVATALPGYGLPSPGDNRKCGATSTVATALRSSSLPSPGDSRKRAATSTSARNKRHKIAMPETAITPTSMNVCESQSRTPMNVNEGEVKEEQVC
jgi:hypothetical protein